MVALGISALSLFFLEVDADVDEEVAGADVLEVVLAEVGEAEVEAELTIDHLVFQAAADAQTGIPAVDVVEGADGVAGGVVLGLATDATGQVATDEGCQEEVVSSLDGIFADDGHLQEVHAALHLLVVVVASAALLREEESCLQPYGCRVGQLESIDAAEGEAGIGIHVVLGDVAGQRRYVEAEAESVVALRVVVVVAAARAVGFKLCERRGSDGYRQYQ